MGGIFQLLGALTATFGVYGVYKLAKVAYGQWTSPLNILPGLPFSQLLLGNLKEIWAEEDSMEPGELIEKYGTTFRFRGLFGKKRLYTIDPKALNHILMNHNDYQKPEASRHGLTSIMGAGVLVVEGDKHRQQRKIMNPAFGPAHVRELTEIFVKKSIQLRDIWIEEISKGRGQIDVLSWLSKMTLDVIGLAGFNYKFDSLTRPGEDELHDAFSHVLRASTNVSVFAALRYAFPIFRSLPAPGDAAAEKARRTMLHIGSKLLVDSKAAIEQNKGSGKSKDLLSLLVRANTSTELTDNQRMSDGDVLAQVPTFLVAGHETTSIATTWALFALTQSPDVQVKLRNELLSVSTDNPTMEELNALPYLDAVVRETLRLHAPVSSTARQAMKDDVIPLAIPFTDKKGVVHHEIRIKKGQSFSIPIIQINRSRSIWGEDAFEFKPERWESLPESASSIPGVWGNMLTFISGPRSCIGYRFALVELKALLFTLVRAFEFELAVPVKDIVKRSSGLVHRPVLLTDPDGGNQMPLIIRPFQRP
ncbi:hypothetical protein K443DRAFT_676331 [Laccaria amethystina LaAM-08-1]|uniref:Cytochrome P450 n=1 Tax=Laccaria amethystina LaAM-08-1 TaxID=1095629 RepID=A0A0C9Y7N4_9AGAR|nr:hypothetical protein K443DRAFT_676331 [Laccaria amethystina LaAM-08-1]